MKKYIKTAVIFWVILFVTAFQTTYIWALKTHDPLVFASSYSDLMEYYNDKSKLRELYDLQSAPLEGIVSFEHFCEVYDFVIDSDMFVYFEDDLTKEIKNIYISFERDYKFPSWISWNTIFPEYSVKVYYILEEKLQQYLEDEGLKSWLQGYRKGSFKGCDGCIRKYRPTETIVLNGKECELFWDVNDKAVMAYDNKLITVSCSSELNADHNDIREIISKIIFSEYISPDEGSDNTDTQDTVTE